jgi:uncharacterized membrane protein
VIVRQSSSPPQPRVRAGHRKAGPPAASWNRWGLASLGLLAILTQLRAAWVAQAILLAGLLILPGVLLLRALRVRGSSIASFPAYVPGASIVVLFGSGLAVDLVGPLIGVAQPLRPEPMLVGLEICCLALLAAGIRAGPETAIPWHSVSRPVRLSVPLLLPLLAAAGALRLNSGHGSTLAIVAVAACGVTLVGVLASADRLDSPLLTVVIYAAALALMWGFSLRGDLIYGYDISSEYYAMQQTVQAGVWHTTHVGDAYGALLSVTVLPAELHAISGISGLILFKAVYPAIGALLPVVTFHLASRMLTRRWAFVAAVLVVAQETFFQQLPGLARQEISLVMFAVLVAAILDGQLARRPQLGLVCLFGLAMAVSHYSTTYFAIVMFAVALVLHWIVSRIRALPPLSPAMAVALGVAVTCAGIWYGLVTRSAANLSQFLNAARGGLNLLPAQGSGNLLSRYLAAGSQVPVSAAEYAKQVAAYYAVHLKWVHPLPGAGNPIYALRSSAQPKPAVRWQLGRGAVNEAGLIIEQLLNLTAALGTLGMVLRRNSSVLCRQAGLLGLGTLGILAMLRISGTVAATYNPERAFLQALVVLGIGICWALQELAGATRKRETAVLALTAAAVSMFLAGTSGLAGEALGGGVKTNLANSGLDYEQFAMTPLELAAANWLSSTAPVGQTIYSDRYGQLRLWASMGNRPAMLTEVTPLTLDEAAWIYADETNVVQRTGLAFFKNEAAAYAFPFGFINANYSRVYTNGLSEVYRR